MVWPPVRVTSEHMAPPHVFQSLRSPHSTAPVTATSAATGSAAPHGQVQDGGSTLLLSEPWNTCQRPQSLVTSLSCTPKGSVCCFRPGEDGRHPALGGRGRSAPLGPYAGQYDTLNVGDQHGFLQTRSAPADQLWQAARKSEEPGNRTACTAVAVGQRPPGLAREHRANQQYAMQQTCGPGWAGGHLWHSSLDLG